MNFVENTVLRKRSHAPILTPAQTNCGLNVPFGTIIWRNKSQHNADRIYDAHRLVVLVEEVAFDEELCTRSFSLKNKQSWFIMIKDTLAWIQHVITFWNEKFWLVITTGIFHISWGTYCHQNQLKSGLQFTNLTYIKILHTSASTFQQVTMW